ncbi:MAG: hypothetical protein LBJ70_01270 [Holosporales bacterium]|nr:hypothetical protein [Holosporales bacterium]
MQEADLKVQFVAAWKLGELEIQRLGTLGEHIQSVLKILKKNLHGTLYDIRYGVQYVAADTLWKLENQSPTLNEGELREVLSILVRSRLERLNGPARWTMAKELACFERRLPGILGKYAPEVQRILAAYQ